jgi:hypothetical protein
MEWGYDWGGLWRDLLPEAEVPAPVKWTERESNEPGAAFLPIEVGALDAVATALERIYKQFERGQHWRDLAELIGECFQDVEDLLHEVSVNRYRSTAVGVQLDDIGELVGQPRGSLTDDELYRVAILVEAAAMVSSGTLPEVIDVVRSIGTNYSVTELYPAGARIRIANLTAAGFALLRRVFLHSPPVGVRVVLSTYLESAVGGWGSIHGTSRPVATWGSIHGTLTEPLSHWSTGRAIGD